MVRLTAELIEQSAQYTNPVRDRELDLRGYRIPVIENLGATLDQFDTIDFSDNDIRKLDGFPLLRRLKCLLFNNNRIVRIGDNLAEVIPNISTLILTNNGIHELGDLDPLTSFTRLEHLSLLQNPVTSKKHYRLYVIYRLPTLRVLDFQRIRQKERDQAARTFKGKKGQQLVAEVGTKSKTFVPGAALPDGKSAPQGPSKEDIEAIKQAIARAATLEEVERLNQMLRSGQIPTIKNLQQQTPPDSDRPKSDEQSRRDSEGEEEEEEEESEEEQEEAERQQNTEEKNEEMENGHENLQDDGEEFQEAANDEDMDT